MKVTHTKAAREGMASRARVAAEKRAAQSASAKRFVLDDDKARARMYDAQFSAAMAAIEQHTEEFYHG